MIKRRKKSEQPHPISIERWHICIAGFLQTEGDPNGIVDLWARLRSLLPKLSTRVELRSWCQNWSDLAELIWRMRPAKESPKVCIYGYSWGGFSAVLLARELKRRGIDVQVIVLCDAVYRHGYLLGQWRAFWPWAKIRVPENVHQVFWFRQKNPRIEWGRSGGMFQPAGHDVVAVDPKRTRVHQPVLMPCTHAYADEWAAFQNRAVEVAKAM